MQRNVKYIKGVLNNQAGNMCELVNPLQPVDVNVVTALYPIMCILSEA